VKQVYSWGANPNGQLGLDHRDSKLTPNLIPSIQNPVTVSAGVTHSLILTEKDEQHKLWVMGDASQGATGISSQCTGSFEVPTHVKNLKLGAGQKVKKIAAGHGTSYALVI
jgi:hypothetical protein